MKIQSWRSPGEIPGKFFGERSPSTLLEMWVSPIVDQDLWGGITGEVPRGEKGRTLGNGADPEVSHCGVGAVLGWKTVQFPIAPKIPGTRAAMVGSDRPGIMSPGRVPPNLDLDLGRGGAFPYDGWMVSLDFTTHHVDQKTTPGRIGHG